MENTLKRTYCFLVQRGTFKKNITDFNTRKDIIDLHYMGYSEFEWGALPLSTVRMLVNIDFYDIITFPQYLNQNNEELKVYAPRMFIDHISDIADALVNKKIHLKSFINLSEYLKGDKNCHYTDFWWDIENDFYVFFG